MLVKQFNFLKYRQITTIEIVTLHEKLLFFFIKSLKKQEKEADTNFLYYGSGEIWLDNSKKRVCIDRSRFHIFKHPWDFKSV